MNTIEIKTDLSGEKLQVLMWEIEAFCEGKQLSKPVLRQADVSGELDCETNPYFLTGDELKRTEDARKAGRN